MELPVQPSSQPSRRRNFEQAPWCYLLWGVPVVLVVAGIAYGESLLSIPARDVLWVVAVAWAGTGCLINGRSCGRVHCRIDGILFPILSIVGGVERAFSHLVRLEPVLARFHYHSSRELCSRMDLEKVLLTHSARKALTTLPYPITITPTMRGTWP